MKKTWGLLFLAFLACCSLQAGEFALKVNDVSGLNSPWPLVASIPFPEGEMKDASAIRIMSGGREVPSQVDVTATWRDGSIRWVLAGFTATPQGKYSVEYGEGVKRGLFANPLQVKREANGSFTVDTGAAVYQFDNDKLLPENGWLVSGGQKVQILKGSGAGVYVIDNAGRTARVSGEAAEISNEVLKEGPGRFAVKRSGWYVTDNGDRLARAEVWLYFSAGVPYVKITHSIIFTEDTNKVWFKDYGLEFKTPEVPVNVFCSVGTRGREDIVKVETEGDEVYLVQETSPHFLEREYRGFIGQTVNADGKAQERIIKEFPLAGEWAYGDYGNYGLTLVMPWLAERFPKEISFGPYGAHAVLWSNRCGKELDFRSKTVVEEYYQTWGKKYYKPVWGSGAKNIAEEKSNAQGAARTHDIWLLPRTGGFAETVSQTATAAAGNVLVMADTAWLCETEAMGYPMLHKDTERFPEEEALISDFWDRMELPMKAFPVNGFIAWGMVPGRYEERENLIMMEWRSFFLSEYGMKRETWRHYARSGERRFYELGHKFSIFSGDWALIQWNAPGKERGNFLDARYSPFLWEGQTSRYITHGGDIGHWLYDYYLTGDERSLHMVKVVQEAFNKYWTENTNVQLPTPFLSMRALLTVAMLDWSKESLERTKNAASSIIDLKSQNGIKLTANGGYGPEYKDHRASHNLLENYLETGDEVVKTAFLKLIDQRYRFDRRENAISYKNYDGFTYSLAYWMTGDTRYRNVVKQILRDSLYYSRMHPLSAELAQFSSDPLEWKRLPSYLGSWEWHDPFIGIPTALKLIAEKGWSGEITPLVVKPMDIVEGKVLFGHTRGRDTIINMTLHRRLPEDVRIGVSKYPFEKGSRFIQGVRIEMEKRMAPGPYFLKNPVYSDDRHGEIYASVILPGETDSGFYILSTGGEGSFTILDSTAEKLALYCPEGFWSVSGGSMPYGRSAEGMPVFFLVPEGLEKIEILLTRPATVRRPDKSIALELSSQNTGIVSVPVDGKYGAWSIEPGILNFKGMCPPSFFKLLNVEPVISFVSPEYLPELDNIGHVAPADHLPLSSESLEFTPGMDGKAVNLSGERTLVFPCEDKLPSGGFKFIPATTGTVEFWFRANESTHEIPLKENTRTIYQYFLRGPHLNLNHRYYTRNDVRALYSTNRIEFLSGERKQSVSGREVEHFFRKGEWTHMAYTWDIREGAKNMEGHVNIFINGKRLPLSNPMYGVKQFPGSGKFRFSESGNEVEIGPFEGAMDTLRISDNVRYREDFVPLQTVPAMDANTRALFLFDGNLKGVSAFSKETFEAK